ncbi:hypothetical protein [Tuwongella immobilis]|uniref:Uncharacterized protein n=1 Tax=Tuwongella immobilis TaxID=692036 RepID=A0A6C2YLY2_9BACT|nr:hypothetical protein [Tuwongella immobilis]VIP02095.1 unnamed protein product [Tuwongella immobilis]VTS00371.1 unnamed protein product [Tuwongella immobilis]
MSDKYIRVTLFRNSSDIGLSFIRDMADACGLKFFHPATSAFVTWTPHGSNAESDLSTFRSAILNGRRIAFQLWWNEREDLFCTFDTSIFFVSYDMSLRGVSRIHIGELLSAMEKLIPLSTYIDWFAALVFDEHGYSAETPWDDRFIQGFSPDDMLPETVILSPRIPGLNLLDSRQFNISKINTEFIRLYRKSGG